MGASGGLTRKTGAVVCAAALLGAVALADATTKTKSGIVSSGATRAFTAKCPKGERVDVGGFRSTVNEPSGILIEDLTFKGSRKWRASFDGLGDSAPAASIAYCADTPKLTKRKDSSVAPGEPRAARVAWRGLGSAAVLKATATCPQGETVQLGGFTVRDPATPSERGGAPSSFRPSAMLATSARKWQVRGLAQPGTKLTALAGCSNQDAPKAVKKTETIEGGGTRTSVKAKCRSGDKVAMGGFKQTRFQGNGPYLRALKRTSPRTWKATSWEFGDPGRLTAIAYCR
jgi:hypothetical protein